MDFYGFLAGAEFLGDLFVKHACDGPAQNFALSGRQGFNRCIDLYFLSFFLYFMRVEHNGLNNCTTKIHRYKRPKSSTGLQSQVLQNCLFEATYQPL